MMATDPFDPNLDRALERRAASRHPHTWNGQPVLTIPTLFGVVHVAHSEERDCVAANGCREEDPTP